jgi:hypothetical protein
MPKSKSKSKSEQAQVQGEVVTGHNRALFFTHFSVFGRQTPDAGLKCGRRGGINKTLSNCLPALALLARAVFYCLCTLNANTPTPTTVRASLASARTPLKPPLARLLE